MSMSPLKVAALGVDDHMRRLINMAFQGPGKGNCVLSDIKEAQVFIVNFDHVDGKNQWEKYHAEYPDHPAIIMSLSDPQVEDASFLQKPFKIETLLEMLKNNQNQLSEAKKKNTQSDTLSTPESIKFTAPSDDQEFCGSQKDVDLNNVAALASIYYKPSDYLQEQIFYAYRISTTDKVAVQIAVKLNDKWELITFLPTLNGVFTTLSDFQMRVICTAPKYCSETKTHRYSLDETLILENGPRTKTSIQAIEPFLWKVALWTSRGRIPEGTSLTKPIRLSRWPNLTRLHTIPNCMRVSTLLIDDARPLKVVTKVLGIPQRHVFAFYSAAYSIGLLSVSGGNASLDDGLPGKRHKQHSLLGKILRKLTGAVTS